MIMLDLHCTELEYYGRFTLYMVLTTLGYYAPWIMLLPSLQLTLPEGTQPRWGHTITSFRLDEDRVHATTFGGCPEYDSNRSDGPKLADTTVMEFGE